MMIINLRGTNGSGKSTIVRQVMAHFEMKPVFKETRRQPIGYHSDKLWVVGHYETECGGCDTISSLDDVYGEVSLAALKGYNVLYEGIMASGEYRRCVALKKSGQDVLAIGLKVPIDVCIEAIKERRARREMTKPLDTARTIRRNREVNSMMEHLKICGVKTQWMTREEALDHCLSLLGVDV